MAKVSEDLLSPNHTPSSAKGSGVKRVNNGPIWLMVGIAVVCVGVVALGAKDRADQQKQSDEPAPQTATNTRSSKSFAKDLTSGIEGSFIQPETPAAPVAPVAPEPVAQATPGNDGAQGSVKVVLPDNLEAPPAPDHRDSAITDEMRERARTDRFERFAQALQAKTAVSAEGLEQAREGRRQEGGGSQSRSSIAAQRAALQAKRDQLQAMMADQADPTANYMAKLAAAKRAAAGGGIVSDGQVDSSAEGDSPFIRTGSKATYSQFDRGEDVPDRWELNSTVQKPRSAYELRAGFVIPATMISGINSDLPGQIIAQVNQDVHDTATQRNVLIPQGARLVGSYASDVAYGQERLLVAWQRIVFPDGKALDIGSMAGADAAGYSGFNDQVNNHLFRLFGSAFLMSGITAGISLSQDRSASGESDRTDASSAMSEALGQQLGQVTAQLIAKNLNVAPTLEIRPGYRFNVVVTKDITLSRSYKSFDY